MTIECYFVLVNLFHVFKYRLKKNLILKSKIITTKNIFVGQKLTLHN